MLYLRHDNRQSRYASTKDGKAKAFKDILTLGLTEFDVYDSDSREVIFGAYAVRAEGTNTDDFVYCKSLNKARAAYAALKAEGCYTSFVVTRYDLETRSWVTVYDSDAKAA